MRIVTLVTATAILGYWTGNPHVVDWQAQQQAEQEKAAAIELSCGDVDGLMQQECAEDLAEEFSSGLTTPMSIFQLHCNQFENVWEIRDTHRRPDLCERYRVGSMPS